MANVLTEDKVVVVAMKKDIIGNCDVAKDMVEKYGKHGGLSDLFEHIEALVRREIIDSQEFNIYAKKAVPYITMLTSAVLARNLGDVDTSVSGLIGLGPGLTPSCDDMLMGFMSSLLFVTEALGGDSDYAREVNQTIISFVDGHTTLLSQRLLEYAARGEAPELVSNLVEAIATGTEEQVKKDASKLLAVGHSSGTDTLLGVLLGFGVAVNMA